MIKQTSDETLVMEARLLAPDVRAARIAELEAELVRLRLPPFIEYPKTLPDGRVVESAEAEALALAPPAPDETALPEPDYDDAKTSKPKKVTVR